MLLEWVCWNILSWWCGFLTLNEVQFVRHDERSRNRLGTVLIWENDSGTVDSVMVVTTKDSGNFVFYFCVSHLSNRVGDSTMTFYKGSLQETRSKKTIIARVLWCNRYVKRLDLASSTGTAMTMNSKADFTSDLWPLTS